MTDVGFVTRRMLDSLCEWVFSLLRILSVNLIFAFLKVFSKILRPPLSSTLSLSTGIHKKKLMSFSSVHIKDSNVLTLVIIVKSKQTFLTVLIFFYNNFIYHQWKKKKYIYKRTINIELWPQFLNFQYNFFPSIILPAAWHFVISRFHCIAKLALLRWPKNLWLI